MLYLILNKLYPRKKNIQFIFYKGLPDLFSSFCWLSSKLANKLSPWSWLQDFFLGGWYFFTEMGSQIWRKTYFRLPPPPLLQLPAWMDLDVNMFWTSPLIAVIDKSRGRQGSHKKTEFTGSIIPCHRQKTKVGAA